MVILHFYREFPHVCGREDCLIGIDSVMRRVEAEVCPIPFCNRRSRQDRRAKEHVFPDATADRYRPGKTIFFDDCAADIVGHSITDCFTNKANNIHTPWVSFDFARPEFGPRVRGLDTVAKFSVSYWENGFRSPEFIMLTLLLAVRTP
jgi:hypothetical protein